LKQAVPKKCIRAAHVHPNENGGQPSERDIDDAKKLGKPNVGYRVIRKDGLFMVRPSDGAVIKVYDGTNWMEKKKK
jgi:hypothetical protein